MQLAWGREVSDTMDCRVLMGGVDATTTRFARFRSVYVASSP